VLSAAEHCYLRALALGPNSEKKTFLNKRIGILCNEFIDFYMNEIVSKLKSNL